MKYLVGGVLWWLLKRLHPCGLDLTPEMVDAETIARAMAEKWGVA